VTSARHVDPLTDARWDAYVRAHPTATVYHLGGWAAVLRGAYGFRSRCLAREEDGRLRGVLPRMRKKGIVSDARLRSIPVFSYGGPLADTPAGEQRLLEAARELAEREGVRGLSVNTGARRLEAAGYESEEILPRWLVEVPEDLEGLRAGWRKTSNNLFRSLKKADAAGLVFREGGSIGDLRSFHRLYVATMRRHRSLPRTLRQLRLARDHLEPHMKVFIVAHDNRDVAAGVYHVFGDTIELVYNGSDDDALKMRPNHFLYWQVMRWAAERGLRWIDLGGAYADTPLAGFKQQWGAEPRARFRLNHRAGGAGTRAESLAQVGYGAEGSESRLVDLAWRAMPTPLLRAGAHVAYRYV
jgi:CelD/BcsL family acetyltransferase involved in cellulose biosynthesis